MRARLRRLHGLHVLADDAPRWKWSPVEQARAACAGGASVVQLRAKESPDGVTLALAREIRELTSAHDVLFIVNDRFDLALASDADGVHLGQGDLHPARIPEAARRGLLVGRSTHTPEQARGARDEPIDYLAFGPVFGTASKQSAWSARGSESLAEIAAIAGPLPLVAIGGHGAISTSSNVAPEAVGALVQACRAGEMERARELHYQLLPLFDVLFCETNPIPVKGALAAMGLISPEIRLPLTPLSEANRERLQVVLKELGHL